MATWFEQRPGSEETLLALYDAVPDAEELDLEEQAAFEEFWAWAWGRDQHGFVVWKWWADEDDDDHAPTVEVDALADEDARPSMSQALGMVEHLLGGRPVAGSDPGA